jgi:hypothetical protein
VVNMGNDAKITDMFHVSNLRFTTD